MGLSWVREVKPKMEAHSRLRKPFRELKVHHCGPRVASQWVVGEVQLEPAAGLGSGAEG